MKRLLTLVLVFAIGWGGYWFIGAQGVKSGFETWFATRANEGWQAETSKISVQGFPNRFDTEFTALALADPATGLAWEAPFFQIKTLSYKPNHLIAIWPNTQTLSTPEQKLDVESASMRASLVLNAAETLPLERANFAADELAVQSSDGWSSSAQTLRLAVERIATKTSTYRLDFAATGFAPPAGFRQLQGDILPATFETMTAQMEVEFTAPWDRLTLEQQRPQPSHINIKMIDTTWGKLQLQVAGEVSVDAKGLPTGEITIRARNWRDMIELARQSGQVPDAVLSTVMQGLDLWAGLSGHPEMLDVPLTFRNGTTLVGPVPIAPAPKLIIR